MLIYDVALPRELSRLLNRAFKKFANMDHDMHFFTMSLKEWKYFCSVLEITTGKAAVVTQRQIRQSFWRAQGAFAPDHGAAVAVKEREEFLEKISADPEEEVSVHSGDNLLC